MEWWTRALEDLVMTMSLWKGRRVFLTGHTGFIGSWLALYLESRGAIVYGLALDPPTDPNLFNLARVGDALRKDERGDIRDARLVAAALRAAAPDIVFHLAAQPLVLRSYADPCETYAVNVLGTVNVLEAVRLVGDVRAVVVMTSDKCYANSGAGQVFREGDALGGHDPYSSSKACTELVTAAYRDSYFLPTNTCFIATVRAGNVVGGGDWQKDRLVPDCVRAVMTGKPVVVRNPTAIRPWQHVLEVVSGCERLGYQLLGPSGAAYAAPWNLGPDDQGVLTAKTVADDVMALLRGEVHVSLPDGPPREAPVLRIDNAQARRHLQWQPRWDARRAIQETARWYKAFIEQGDVAALTRAQIEEFFESTAA